MEGTNNHTEGGAVAATADTLVTALTKAKRPTSAYDEPTPEKIAFGRRMKEAREIAGLSQCEAADAMGYSQQVQLHLMETGQRMPTLRVLVHCAALYGTTMDFLSGLVEDSDRDPALALQREVAGRVAADVRRLIATVTVGAADAVRQLRPDAGRTARLAGQVVALAATLSKMREREGHAFDDLHAGAQLVARVNDALDTARETLAAMARAQRKAAAIPVDLAGIGAIDAAGDLAALAAQLCRLSPLPAGQAAVEDADQGGDATNISETEP